MISMTFDKEEVLASLTANLEEHKTIFKEAVEGFRLECIKQLEEKLGRVLEGPGPVNVYVTIKAPENHESDYKAVIHMLQHSNDKEVTFNDTQYRCYMLDKWV